MLLSTAVRKQKKYLKKWAEPMEVPHNDDILIKQGGDIIAADGFDGNFLYSHILGIKPD